MVMISNWDGSRYGSYNHGIAPQNVLILRFFVQGHCKQKTEADFTAGRGP